MSDEPTPMTATILPSGIVEFGAKHYHSLDFVYGYNAGIERAVIELRAKDLHDEAREIQKFTIQLTEAK